MTLSAPKNLIKGSKWTRDEVLLLLCALNLKIFEILPSKAGPTEREWKDIIKSATILLCDEVSFPTSPERIKNKLASLWESCGDPYGDEKPYALYESGAFTKTLPDLENPQKGFPGMLNEISAEVHRRQLLLAGVAPLAQKCRRSNRVGTRDDSNDPILCRCGFTHHIAAIHCDDCHSWQHTLCYYDTQFNDELPRNHRCDSCQGIESTNNIICLSKFDEDVLREQMENMKLEHIQHEVTKIYPATDTSAGSDINLGPFGFPYADKMFWGPEESVIRSTMERVLAQIEEVVYWLLKAGVSIRKIKKTVYERKNLDVKSLLEATHGGAYCTDLTRLLSQPVRSPIKIARMLTGMISSIIFELIFYTQSKSEHSTTSLFWNSICNAILEINGVQTLRQLRRRSLLDILKDRGQSLQSAIKREAMPMSTQVIELLFGMLTVAGASGESLPADVDHCIWQSHVEEIFRLCLELRLHLALSERFFEVRYVLIGSDTTSEPMVNPAGESIEPGKRTEICLMPAILEYDPKVLGKEPAELFVLPVEQIFVRPGPQESSKANPVSPAVVLIAS